jgi:hypothetical protein
MAHNNEAGGSGGKAFWELSQEMEEQPHLYEAAAFPTDPETTDGAAEDDHTDATTDGAAEDATTDDGGARTDSSQPKRQRKDRRPIVLRTLKEEVTEVDSNGNPTAPERIVKGYSLQLGCILRSTVSINTENLRHPDRGNLRHLLFMKLHERYKFPAEFENTSLKGNKVNNAALTKMSKALSTWKSNVKRMIEKGESYEKIKEKNPSITEDDYNDFKINCSSTASSQSSEWGKQMRELNIGEHTLGPGGYRVAEPIWDKEEADRAEQGLPPFFDKYGDKQTRNFVRARYKKDPKTKELTTDPKTRKLELVLVRNTPPRN